jgi:integrase
VLSDAELRALWRETEAPADFHAIVRLCLWTGCRRGEAGGMRWSELDGSTWRIPGARVKNGRELVLPLAHQTVTALQRLPVFVGRDHVFGVRSPSGFNNWREAKSQLDARLRFNEAWRVHDCRRCVQTRMAALGINRDVVNRLLNHAVGAIDAAYDHHTYFTEKRDALQLWADELDSIVSLC